MAQISTELGVLMFIMFFMGLMIFFYTLPDFPEELKFLNIFDFLWIGGGVIGITAACVVTSGIPCAITLVLWAISGVISLALNGCSLLDPIGCVTNVFATLISGGLSGFTTYFLSTNMLIKYIIMFPMMIGLIYIISRLAKGGG